MSFKMKYQIKQDFLPINTKRRSGKKISKVRFLVAHDTGNPNSTAKGNVTYYKNSANNESASAHIFVDDKEIIECIPAFKIPEKAWHVLYNKPKDNQLFGYDSNDVAIGVELAYSVNGGKINNEESYKKYVWVLAYLCYFYELNPLKHITGHHILDPQRKTDPVNALSKMGKTYDGLLKDVHKELIECQKVETKGGLSMSEYLELKKEIADLRKLIQGEGDIPSIWAKDIWDKKVYEKYFDGTAPQGVLTREQGAMLIERLVQNIDKYKIEPLVKQLEKLQDK